jgi:tetratricopeptide (TPR) repeat protein
MIEESRPVGASRFRDDGSQGWRPGLSNLSPLGLSNPAIFLPAILLFAVLNAVAWADDQERDKMNANYEKEIARLTEQIDKTPRTVDLYSRRGDAYFFRGKFIEAVADYEKMAASPDFRRGLSQLKEAAAQHSLAVMCSEADPLECHRCLLVGRALAGEGADVRHILASGEVMTHVEAEDRLLALQNLSEEGLFASREERLAEAYRSRSRKHAYAQAR